MGKGSSNKAAAQARWDEEQRQQRIRGGTNSINSAFGQFNDDFYNNRSNAYTQYANPQLEDQYAGAQKELTYALARSGQLDSSARAEREAELQKLYDTHKQDINDKGLSYAATAKSNVEDARSGLISMLNASGDDTGAANSAISRANVLSQSDTYSPLTNLFTDLVNSWGKQYATQKSVADSGQSYKSPYGSGLNSSNSSVAVAK